VRTALDVMDQGIEYQWIAGKIDILYAQVSQCLILINLLNHLGQHHFIFYLNLLQSKLFEPLCQYLIEYHKALCTHLIHADLHMLYNK
jgi:hypothetical protein